MTPTPTPMPLPPGALTTIDNPALLLILLVALLLGGWLIWTSSGPDHRPTAESQQTLARRARRNKKS